MASDEILRFIRPLEQVSEALPTGQYNQDVQRLADVGSLVFSTQGKAAVVVVAVRGGQQESWARQEEMSVALYEKLATALPPDAAIGSFRSLDGNAPVTRDRCSNCRIRPGFGPCPRCSGVGVLIVQRGNSESTVVEDCPDCEDGFASCTMCGGTQQTVRATLHYINRKPFFTNHLIAPDVPESVLSAVRSAFADVPELPRALAFDPFGDAGVSAYRGSQGERDATVHGFPLGRAVGQAKAFVDRVRAAPNLIVQSLEAYVVPLVVAHFVSGSRNVGVAFFVDAAGALRFHVV